MILYSYLYMVNEMNSFVLQPTKKTNKQDDQRLITSWEGL